MTNSADPDQLASSEANWSGSTLFAKTGHVVFSKRRVDHCIFQKTCQVSLWKLFKPLKKKKKKCWTFISKYNNRHPAQCLVIRESPEASLNQDKDEPSPGFSLRGSWRPKWLSQILFWPPKILFFFVALQYDIYPKYSNTSFPYLL